MDRKQTVALSHLSALTHFPIKQCFLYEELLRATRPFSSDKSIRLGVSLTRKRLLTQLFNGAPFTYPAEGYTERETSNLNRDFRELFFLSLSERTELLRAEHLSHGYTCER